jgi:NADH/F420H2 dehydrogenase subunit C
MDRETVYEAVKRAMPEAEPRLDYMPPSMATPLDKLHALLEHLRDDPALAFDMLFDHTAIDRPSEQKIELLYHLFSLKHGHRLFVTTDVPREAPVAPTVSDLWPIAEWQEREVYDLFGVLYDGHPDLRRIFLDDDWKGFPLRKDYKDEYMLERPK